MLCKQQQECKGTLHSCADVIIWETMVCNVWILKVNVDFC